MKALFRIIQAVLTAFIFFGAGDLCLAQTLTSLDEIRLSGDITTTLPGSGSSTYSKNDSIITFNMVTGTAVSSQHLGDLAAGNIDAYHNVGDGCGAALYSLDTAMTINGTTMVPADVFNAAGNKILDAESAHIPRQVNIDAISRNPATGVDHCKVLFSVDTTTTLDGTPFRADDIIQYDGLSNFSLYYSPDLKANIDALHIIDENLILLSFETTTKLADLDAHDDEVIEMNISANSYQLLSFQPQNFNNSWQGASLDALWAKKAANPGTFQWQLAQTSVNENSGQLSVSIERINGLEGDIQLNVSTSNLSATAGQDYSSTNANYTVLSGTNSVNVNIPILNDTQFEGSEFFKVTITAASNNAIIGSPSTVQVEILDDEDFIFRDGFEPAQ